MPFQKKWLGEFRETKSKVFSIWLNAEDKLDVLELGILLRQSKVSTILKQAVCIAKAKLIAEEKLTDILLGNERKNKRNGIGELELVEIELIKNLKEVDKTKRKIEDC